ncbi:hypothetical protein [Armatimonas rosea]|uniref:Uncharacterized protein n=1 Tax=Armatimonas rosea TaxID=685828 RepID=A0A7W9SQW2_ARMRO|nr:hypothetical protein [Armatimonas rosea]MBB6051142.1 hypothetical protein [Armatimonas rosea]
MLAAFLCLLLADPISYRISLADGTRTTARLTLPTTAEGAVQVDSDDTRSVFRPYAVSGATASVVGKLTRWEALPLKGGWRLQRPQGGALPLDAPLLTFHDLRLFLGKRIEELGSKPLRFWQLGYASERPGLDRVELTPAGTESMVVGTKRVLAQRYRASIKLWLTGKTQRSTLYLGPSGELLRADPPFVSAPLRAASPLTKSDDGVLTMTYREPGYSLRAEPKDGGYTIRAIVDGRSLPGSVTTDSSGKPQRIENSFPGKPFVGLVEAQELSWTLDAPQTSRTILPDDDALPLFPPQLFATALWEKGFPTVGTQHDGVLLLMHDGLPDELTLERLPDPAAGLHRYRFTGDTFKAELITDGTRLRLLRLADGSQIVASDGESLLTTIPALTWP